MPVFRISANSWLRIKISDTALANDDYLWGNELSACGGFSSTGDNGQEFADHKIVSQQLELDFYFARAYHSWERGANENTNGLIRQYIPKKTDFNKITNEYVKYVQKESNIKHKQTICFLTRKEK